MAQFPNSESYHGVMTPFWLEPVKKDVMGYKLTNVASGDIIERGIPAPGVCVSITTTAPVRVATAVGSTTTSTRRRVSPSITI